MNKKPTWCHLLLYRFLCAQHVSDINISTIRSLRLRCWITTSVVLFSFRCVLEIWYGWVWVVSVLQAAAQLVCSCGLCFTKHVYFTGIKLCTVNKWMIQNYSPTTIIFSRSIFSCNKFRLFSEQWGTLRLTRLCFGCVCYVQNIDNFPKQSGLLSCAKHIQWYLG